MDDEHKFPNLVVTSNDYIFKVPSDTDDYTLSSIAASACISVLEEAIDELTVLGALGNLPKVEADLTYKTIEARFSVRKPEVSIFDRETIEPYEVALYKQKFVKFQRDRSFIEKVLKETIKNLTDDHSYMSLIKYINQHNLQSYEENQLLQEELENKTKLQKLLDLIEKERCESLSAFQVLSEKIGKLKDEVEDVIIETKVKTRYITNWENARNEQNNLTLDKQEEYYMSSLNKKKLDIEREIRINAEIEAFIRETQNEYQDSIQMWMERYDKGIEFIDMEIQILNEKREEQFHHIQQLSQLYELHKNQMNAYLEVKEKRRQEAELLAKREKAATKIQAWWRGTMVRKGFGQFQKKGKKGKNDKKKGKKS